MEYHMNSKKKITSHKSWQQNKNLDRLIEDYTVGNDHTLDQKLVRYDCQASIAHTRMLGKMGIFTPLEVEELTEEFNNIIQLNKLGQFTIRKTEEDCHTAIENHLTKKLGEWGKKYIHSVPETIRLSPPSGYSTGTNYKNATV